MHISKAYQVKMGLFCLHILPVVLHLVARALCRYYLLQVTLYTVMCSERRREIEAGILLYLRELAVQLVPADYANKRGQ